MSAWRGWALNAWSADRTEDTDGIFFYLHDLDRDTVWSAGFQPTAVTPDSYSAEGNLGGFLVQRSNHGIATTMRVCVVPDSDVELRVLVVSNQSNIRRRIAVSTFCEVVLLDAPAHAAHPAFVKLFVQTEFEGGANALLARRRKRAPGDPSLWMLHAFHGPGALQFETDRTRFIGRGRSKVKPSMIASAEPLSGTVGSVLDSVFTLRRVVELAPGESVQLTLVSTAGESREAILSNAARFADGAAAFDAFVAASVAETSLRHRLNITERELLYFDSLAAALLYAHPVVHPGRIVPCDRNAILGELEIPAYGSLSR
jgi:cyclic beta-1,2-glucan synthetase